MRVVVCAFHLTKCSSSDTDTRADAKYSNVSYCGYWPCHAVPSARRHPSRQLEAMSRVREWSVSLSADQALRLISDRIEAERGSVIDRARGSGLTGEVVDGRFALRRSMLSVGGYHSVESTYITGSVAEAEAGAIVQWSPAPRPQVVLWLIPISLFTLVLLGAALVQLARYGVGPLLLAVGIGSMVIIGALRAAHSLVQPEPDPYLVGELEEALRGHIVA
jgi:hypothetical protein